MAYKSIDLMKAGPPGQPLDLQAQQAALAQQAAIANALIAQSMERSSPIIHTGGGNQFARDIPNFGDPIAKVVQSIQGRKQLDEATRGQAELNAEQERRSRAEMGGILGARFGQQAPGGTGVDDSGEQMPNVGQKPSFLRALQLASQASTPAGKAMLAELLKGTITPEEAYKNAQHFDLPTVAKTLETQDLGNLKPKIEAKEFEGAVRPYQAGAPIGPSTAIETFGAPRVNPIGVPVQTAETTGRERPYGQYGDVSTTKARENKLSEEDMKTLGEGRKTYLEGLKSIGNIAQLQSDIQDMNPERFGSFADLRVAAQKLAQTLGGKIDEKNATMETVHSNLGNLMIAKIRALAPVTKEDVNMMQSIIGSENNTKAALERILDVGAAAIARDLQQHRKFVENLSGQPGVDAGIVQRYAPDFNITGLPPKRLGDDDLRKKYGIQ